MNARSSFILSSFALALGLALAACGGGSGETGSTSGSTAGGETTGGSTSSGSAAGDPAAGKTFADSKGCAGCHGADYSGGTSPLMGVYAANITPDKTNGIGGWTDDQIKMAVKMGMDDAGMPLCASMLRFSDATDKELTDLVAFLRSLTPVSKAVMEGTCK